MALGNFDEVQTMSLSDHFNESIKVEAIKCMIVGDSKTGKTTLYKNLLNHEIPPEYEPTIFDANTVGLNHNGNKISLTVWDSAGSSAFDSIRPISYAHTDCFIICYAVDDKTSYENVKKRWLPEIISHGDGPKVPVILVATKCDTLSTVETEIENQPAENECCRKGNEMKEKVNARAFFQYSKAITFTEAKVILDKMIELACIKKIEEEKPPNPIWKFQSLNIIITGDEGVGKSSVIEACIKDQKNLVKTGIKPQNRRLQEYYHDFVTNGCEYFLRIIELPFSYSETLYELCEQTDAILLCYAINDPFSFQSVELQCRKISQHLSKDVPIILIGNKIDLKVASDILIPTEDGLELMEQLKCSNFIECSAESLESISKVFGTIADIFTKNDNNPQSN